MLSDNDAIDLELRKLYNRWVKAGKENDWHRIASQYELPRETKLMLEHFQQILLVEKKD